MYVYMYVYDAHAYVQEHARLGANASVIPISEGQTASRRSARTTAQRGATTSIQARRAIVS